MADVRCPRCLSLNPAGAAACRQCGAPLAGAAPVRSSSWNTLFLTGLWLALGPGILMPLFFLSPGFVHGSGAPLRIAGALAYFLVAAGVLGPFTVRYFRRS